MYWIDTSEEGSDTSTIYTITRNLTNCTSSSKITSISEGLAHTETITANNGYTLTGATVSVRIISQIVVPGSNTDALHDRRLDYHINCHPVTINIAMRDLLAIENQQEKHSNQKRETTKQSQKNSPKKTSIRKKLERNKAIIAAGTDKSQASKRDNPQLS